MPRDADTSDAPVYSPAARAFHWLTVVLVAAMIPVGFLMTWRGKTLKVWDATTNALYSGHKLVGMIVLIVVAMRLVYRLAKGAPPDEPTIEPWQRVVSHITHWLLYALLLVMPILGWLGVSLFPALQIFGGLSLPGLVAPDQARSALVFWWHGMVAWALIGLVGMHVAAALYHHLIRKDGVLRRMLPSLRQRR